MEHRRNPFRDTDVNSIYDKIDFPIVLSYCEKQKDELLRAISSYKQNKFSYPIINIFGPTGCGKTFLLYHLTREFHQNKTGFFIDISPFEAVEETQMEKYLWEKIEHFLCQKLPNYHYRPIDFWLYKLYMSKTQEAKSIESDVRYGFIFKKKIPVYSSFEHFLLEFKTHKHREKILQCLFKKPSAINSWLMNCFLEKQTKCENEITQIADIASFANSLNMPIILVSDQFENMDKSRFRKPIGIFFNEVIEAIRKIKLTNSNVAPLFINLLNDTHHDHLVNHVNTRLPTLPNGKDRIIIDKGLSKEQALEIVKCYLARTSRPNNEFYPFTLEVVENHYNKYASQFSKDIRTWLIYCRNVWEMEVSNTQQPYISKDTANLQPEHEKQQEKIVSQAKETGDSSEKSDQKEQNISSNKEQDSNTNHHNTNYVDKKAQTNNHSLIEMRSLNDVYGHLLQGIFLKEIKHIYKQDAERLEPLVYVLIDSLQEMLDIYNISSLEKHYFCFHRNNKKFYVFFCSKSNRGKGFITSWNEFKECINKNENYFIKCIRSKNEDIPNRREFSVLRHKKKSHCYSFDIEGPDIDWLKNIYGTIYLLGNDEKLKEYELPELKYPGLVWKKIAPENFQENILRHIQENILKGIL